MDFGAIFQIDQVVMCIGLRGDLPPKDLELGNEKRHCD